MFAQTSREVFKVLILLPLSTDGLWTFAKKGEERTERRQSLSFLTGQKKSKSGNEGSPPVSTTSLQEYYGLRVEEGRSAHTPPFPGSVPKLVKAFESSGNITQLCSIKRKIFKIYC